MVRVETERHTTPMDDALDAGWSYDGTMLTHPDSMVIIHVPSFDETTAAHMALVHIAIRREQACLLLKPKKQPLKPARQSKRGAAPKVARKEPSQEPAQLVLF